MRSPNPSPPLFERFTVADFMSRVGLVVGPHATLDSALSYFERYDINVLPIVDRLRVIGVLTKTDLLRAFSKRSRGTSTREVQAFMTPKPKTFSPHDPLRKVLEEMAVTRHRSFVVVENDQFVGTISRENVIGALREAGIDRPLTDTAPSPAVARRN
jgi:CBS domain-containing protein